jgi:hypothetical protein
MNHMKQFTPLNPLKPEEKRETERKVRKKDIGAGEERNSWEK